MQKHPHCLTHLSEPHVRLALALRVASLQINDKWVRSRFRLFHFLFLLLVLTSGFSAIFFRSVRVVRVVCFVVNVVLYVLGKLGDFVIIDVIVCRCV